MKPLIFIVLSFIFMNRAESQTFLERQKSYPRVKTAYKEKLSSLEVLLMASELKLNNIELFIRIFKQEKLLEVWGKSKTDTTYKLIINYPLCAVSGSIGPKRTEGDEQMPEGIYNIIYFNPNSNFYLSLKLDYPNLSDIKFCKNNKCGGDIFIHGNCITIGCFPIGDEAIKELYILALEATSQGQNRIPVHIFPCKLTNNNLEEIIKIKPQHEYFWKNLQPIYNYFENTKKLPLIRVNAKGDYEIVK